MGRPGEGVAPSLGAGEEPKGDAFAVFPAEVRREPAPEQPKPANAEAAISDDAPSSVIELAARTTKAAAATAIAHEAAGRVTVRPKPEKRKNAKERAKEKYAKDGTTPDTTAKAKSKAEKAETSRKAKQEKARSGKAKFGKAKSNR